MALRRRGVRAGGGLPGHDPATRAPWRHGLAALRLRRITGAVLLAVAAGVSVEALVPDGVAAAPSVLTAAGDLPVGHVLVPEDLVPAAMPEDVTPAAALRPSDGEEVAGRRLVGAVGAGEVVTEARLAGPGLLAGQPAGTVALALPVLPASADLVRPGDEVVVLAGSTDPLTGAVVPPDDVPAGRPEVDGPPTLGTSAPRTVVLDVPSTAAGGALGSVGADVGDDVVVLAVDETDAPELAQAAAAGAPVVLAVLP